MLVRFPSGTSTVKFAFNITDDDLYEGDETFNLVLDTMHNFIVRGEPFRTTVTIRDDEKSKKFLLSNLYCCLHFISAM